MIFTNGEPAWRRTLEINSGRLRAALQWGECATSQTVQVGD
jgi:hypothetical protein